VVYILGNLLHTALIRLVNITDILEELAVSSLRSKALEDSATNIWHTVYWLWAYSIYCSTEVVCFQFLTILLCLTYLL